MTVTGFCVGDIGIALISDIMDRCHLRIASRIAKKSWWVHRVSGVEDVKFHNDGKRDVFSLFTPVTKVGDIIFFGGSVEELMVFV